MATTNARPHHIRRLATALAVAAVFVGVAPAGSASHSSTVADGSAATTAGTANSNGWQ